MMILALDTATTTGWAAGRSGEPPRWGANDFSDAEGNGAVLGRFRRWLEQSCFDLKPGLIVFEAPYIPIHQKRDPKNPKGPPPMNATALFRLIGFVDFTEAIAWELDIECRQATTGEIAKFFLGSGKIEGGREAKKAATIEMCQAYGWDVEEDDNAADALALWAKAEGAIDPKAAARRREAAIPILEELRMRSAPGAANSRGAETSTNTDGSKKDRQNVRSRQQQFTIF